VDRGVDLQAILDANPGVVPEKLRIGQTVNLPCADGASGKWPAHIHSFIHVTPVAEAHLSNASPFQTPLITPNN
jgi:hypothetical protein